MVKIDNPYKLLRNKEIYTVLDGDMVCGKYNFDDGTILEMRLPYLSGPELCKILTEFDLPTEYPWGGSALSRVTYMQELVDHCIKNDKCSDLLSYLFAKERFSKVLRGRTASEIEDIYPQIVKKVIDYINGILYCSDYEMVIRNKKFIVREKNAKVEIHAPQIKVVDRDYIKDISVRAMQDVERGDFDSAITKSRTLLEEVFCYVLEKKQIIPSTNGKIADLYKQVKNAYNMHTDTTIDQRINMLLSGFEKIVSAISEMRNDNSDSHGVGSKRIKLEQHHATLFVNAAMVMGDFILSVEKKVNV